jgi:hypothetical protein
MPALYIPAATSRKYEFHYFAGAGRNDASK